MDLKKACLKVWSVPIRWLFLLIIFVLLLAWLAFPTTIGASEVAAPQTTSMEIYDPLISSPTAILVLLTPPDNSIVNTLTPVFSWEAASFAFSYEFQLAIDNTFSVATLVFTTNITDTQLTLPEGLSIDYHTYYWRVDAVSPVPTTWSYVFRFTVELTTPPPVWIWPVFVPALVIVPSLVVFVINNQIIKKKTEKTQQKFDNQEITLKTSNVQGKSQVNPDTPFKADIALNIQVVKGESKQSIEVEGSLIP